MEPVIIESQEETEVIDIEPLEVEETKTVHTIQRAEGHKPCFGRSGNQCSWAKCRFLKACRVQSPDNYPSYDPLLPALDLEGYEPVVVQDTGVADKSKGAVRYAWIGAGQCGGRLLKSFHDFGYEKVLAVNTSRRDLDSLAIADGQKFLLDIGREYTGRNMRICAQAVRQHRQDILHSARRVFGQEFGHIMICFGAGGGTGSGSVLELVEIAKIYARHVGLKDPDKKVGVLMTLPAAANVGCPQVAENAHKVARQMTEMASAGEISPLIIVDNDKIAKMYPKLTAQQFYSSINATVANLFDAFNRLGAASSEYTSFDRSDYASIIEAGGTLTMGWTKVDDFNNPFAISEAVKNNLETSLFAVGDDLSAAKVGGCIVVGNRELMASAGGLQENIDYAFDVLTEITGRATIHRGIYEDRGDGLRVYTILGGLETPADRLEEFTSQVYLKPSEYFDNMPLRHRKEDILALADYFLAKEADFYDRPDKTLGPEATALLLNYTWPGNVSELQKAMVRAHELTKDQEILPEALAFEILFADARLYPRTVWPVLAKTKRTIIAKALRLTKSVQSTARLLGIDRARLIRLIENLKIAQVTRVTDS